MPSSPSLPVLGERYVLSELIGQGGNAGVYRALDRRSRRTVAVKRYDPRMRHDIGFVASFRRGVRQACALDHAHVLPTLSYGYADESYYVVSEYVGGGNFEQHRRVSDARAWPEMVWIIAQACAGLDYIHRAGMVHGNLKPTNILLRPDGTALVADVGPVHHLGSSGVTVTDAVVGSVAYYSPEHVTGSPLSPASDVYALGVMLYEACTGRLPFEAPNPLTLAYQHVHDEAPSPRSLKPDLDSVLETVMLCCLAKEPTQRYSTAREVGEALMAWAPTREPEPAEVVPAPESLADVLEQELRSYLDVIQELPPYLDALKRRVLRIFR